MGVYASMIPKRIQLHWFFNPMPEWIRLNIEEYQKVFPDWEILVFTKIPDEFPDQYRKVAELAPLGRHRADVVRYWLMYHYGGFYVDADTRPIRNFEPLCQYDLFLPKIEDSFGRYVDISFIGTKLNHKFWEKLLRGCEVYSKSTEGTGRMRWYSLYNVSKDS